MKVFTSDQKRDLLWRDYDRLLSLWGVPYEERSIDAYGGSTHVVAAGDETLKPLVLLHGVGDDSAVMWLYNIAALAEHFRCYCVDTLGGPGKSVPGADYVKGFDQRRWLDGVLNGLHIGACRMAGVSNGAVTAFSYACHEERVEKLVCIEGGPVTSNAVAWKTLLKAFPEALWPTRKNTIRMMEKFANPRPGFFESVPEITDHMLLIQRAHNRMAMGLQRPALYEAACADAMRGRVLFLMGERSMGASAEYMALLRKDGYRAIVLPGVGHGANMESPEAVNRTMIDFLQ